MSRPPADAARPGAIPATQADQGEWPATPATVRSGAQPGVAGSPAGRWQGPTVDAWVPPAPTGTLDEAFRATLQRGVHGLCFSPYLEGAWRCGSMPWRTATTNPAATGQRASAGG